MNTQLRLKTKVYATLLIVLSAAAAIANYHYYRNTHDSRPRMHPGAEEKNYVQVFSRIYEINEWGNGSGPGSDPKNAQQYMALLQEYFNDARFKTIVDLGCGDWQFMQHIKIPKQKSYLGFDVVPNLIEQNQARFAQSNVQFYHTNSLREFADLNISGDLLIIKDVMQHWPNDEIEYFIANVLPRFKYALITNEYSQDHPLHNKAVPMGPTHSLGLLEPPFNLQSTVKVLEYDGPKPKQVLLYVNPSQA